LKNFSTFFDGLYEVSPLPDYTGQTGQWRVTVDNKQGEIVTANSKFLDNVHVIPLATNLQVTGSIVTWDPVLFDHDNNPTTEDVEVDDYEIRLLNDVGDQFYRSSRIAGNSYVIPPEQFELLTPTRRSFASGQPTETTALWRTAQARSSDSIPKIEPYAC
jgi:hypothetical protein